MRIGVVVGTIVAWWFFLASGPEAHCPFAESRHDVIDQGLNGLLDVLRPLVAIYLLF